MSVAYARKLNERFLEGKTKGHGLPGHAHPDQIRACSLMIVYPPLRLGIMKKL
jgi:hypothetical protein